MAAKKPGKLPTNKKHGKKKSGDSAHAGGYERIGQSSPGKGKVITLDFDSDSDPCDLEDEEAYAKAAAEVKKESKQGKKPLPICVSPPFNCITNGYAYYYICLLYTSPSPRDQRGSRMPSSA